MAGEDMPLIKADDVALGMMHSAVLGSISLFDQKCAMLLTIDSGALVFCVGAVTGLVPGVPADLHLDCIGGALLLIMAALFLGSALFALIVVWPRTRASRDDPLFWDNWPAAVKAQDYVFPAAKLSTAELGPAMARHLGLLGGICRKKKARLSSALWCILGGLSGLLLIAFARTIPWCEHVLAAPVGEEIQRLLQHSV